MAIGSEDSQDNQRIYNRGLSSTMKLRPGTNLRITQYSGSDVQCIDSSPRNRDRYQELSPATNRRGRPSLIGPARMDALLRDLGRPPSQFGYPELIWSGTLLSHHVVRVYGTKISTRQCRRILQTVTASHPTKRYTSSARSAAISPPLLSAAPQSTPGLRSYPSIYRQQMALARLRKLASSGLPVIPLVMAIFEVIEEAIPSSDQKALCTAADGNLRSPDNWIRRSVVDEAKNSARYKYYVSDIPVDRSLIPNPRIFDDRLLDEQPTLPGFHRTETYHEYFQPIGEHHGIVIIARDGTVCVGAYPIWRSATMPEFSVNDIRFAKIAALQIGHALSIAYRLESRRADGEEFRSTEGTQGLILMRPDGRVLAIDQAARSIFTRLAILEGCGMNLLMNQRIAPMLNYIARTLEEILQLRSAVVTNSGAPSRCLFFHRTGITLKLGGFVQEGDAGALYYNVMVEVGELAEHRRKRVSIRYGLSPRETDLLRILGENYRGTEAALEAGIAPATLHKYVREMTEKLGLRGSAQLRQFSRQLRL
jgi:DNA-binding CsgD family transcriptional regulator